MNDTSRAILSPAICQLYGARVGDEQFQTTYGVVANDECFGPLKVRRVSELGIGGELGAL